MGKKSKVTVEGVVTRKQGTQWFNRDEQGNEIKGSRNIQIGLAGGMSFRVAEGDRDFDIVAKKVRPGCIIIIEAGEIKPSPYKQEQTLESGAIVETTGYYLNLNDVTVLDVNKGEQSTATVDPELEDDDEFQFASQEGRQRKKRKTTYAKEGEGEGDEENY